ncbi:GNAT family N-acetyltransferase [Bizionia paragorgiae]|uniref:Acetyltransferase (GNAT) domain-containing protein n=1 Tax=Bizionia paragorgiae TaxID=283786 RepID=A0A1H3ZH76_BIZPA|nr:GNAT family N-acetyltransferase [Bizionia paragorgiae]SEA23129.1 Acetyltransferase (GNAT) domain-containing protein [Bizionia paragorgiae]
MEYHSDRFKEASLLIFRNDKLVAVFPMNAVGNTVISHQGLTYGGLLFGTNVKFNHVLAIFRAVLKHLSESKITTLGLKVLPDIYASFPNDELKYLMFILQAKLERRDVLSVIPLSEVVKRSKDRKEGTKRGVKNGLVVKEETQMEGFWKSLLEVNLQQKYKTKPVHSLEEIQLLKSRFPKNIRQFNVYYKNRLVAGTTIFETEHVAHSQYISGNNENNTLGSLDFLHSYLIDTVFKDKKYFDFGISNENAGKNINSGLLYWKEGFGARTVTQDFYSIQTNKYTLLDAVLL